MIPHVDIPPPAPLKFCITIVCSSLMYYSLSKRMMIPREIEENAYAKSNKCCFKIFLACFKSFEQALTMKLFTGHTFIALIVIFGFRLLLCHYVRLVWNN